MDSIAPNWLIVFRISTSFLAGLIFLGLTPILARRNSDIVFH